MLSQAVLEVRGGARAGERFPVHGDALTLVGRAPYTHVNLAYPNVAPIHCLLAPAREEHGFLLIDAWSPGGTLVNAAPMAKGVVRPGDVIAVGPMELELLESEGEPGPEARDAEAEPPEFVLVPRRAGEPEYALPQRSVVAVGRHELADVQLPDPYVSEFHALLAFEAEEGEAPLLLDLRSSNGTHVDGRPVHWARVLPGQVLTIGRRDYAVRPRGERRARAAEGEDRAVRGSGLGGLPRTTEILFAARPQAADDGGEAKPLGYEGFYGFDDLPFRLTADPDYFFGSARHGETLRALVGWLRKGSPVGLLTGPAGTGKSLLLACAARQLSYRSPAPVVMRVSAAERSLDDLLAAAVARAVELHGELPAYGATLLELWHAVAAELRQRNVLVAFLIDDADTVARDLVPAMPPVLESEDARVATRILLAGRAGLEGLLAEANMTGLVGLRRELGALGTEEVAAYMGHRLLCASGRRDRLFTRRAVELIAAYAKGVPRLVNVAADAALFGAFRAGQRFVDGQAVESAIRDALGPEPA